MSKSTAYTVRLNGVRYGMLYKGLYLLQGADGPCNTNQGSGRYKATKIAGGGNQPMVSSRIQSAYQISGLPLAEQFICKSIRKIELALCREDRSISPR